MAVTIDSPRDSSIVAIEPNDRVVVLSRTIQVDSAQAESTLKQGVADYARFGDSCLGQALYRHRSVYHSATDALVWSHTELSYFRHNVNVAAINELVAGTQPSDAQLLRAELLLTSPGSFILPLGWHGSTDQPDRQASLEFIQVQPAYLDEYRDVMRGYCGPAAAKLVRADKVGTFRAMETAAVLYQNPQFSVEWNQIHLCELEVDGFEGFGNAFGDALREDLTDGDELPDTFAGLDRMRTVTRWTFNDLVAQADAAIAQRGRS